MTHLIPPTHNRSPLEVVTVTGSHVCVRCTQITPAVRWFPLEAVDTLANKDALDTVAPMQGCQMPCAIVVYVTPEMRESITKSSGVELVVKVAA